MLIGVCAYGQYSGKYTILIGVVSGVGGHRFARINQKKAITVTILREAGHHGCHRASSSRICQFDDFPLDLTSVIAQLPCRPDAGRTKPGRSA